MDPLSPLETPEIQFGEPFPITKADFNGVSREDSANENSLVKETPRISSRKSELISISDVPLR
jgi:hypothetical protein